MVMVVEEDVVVLLAAAAAAAAVDAAEEGRAGVAHSRPTRREDVPTLAKAATTEGSVALKTRHRADDEDEAEDDEAAARSCAGVIRLWVALTTAPSNEHQGSKACSGTPNRGRVRGMRMVVPPRAGPAWGWTAP